MKNPFKDFLYFSRGERRGILVLIIGIILIFLSGYIYSFRQNSRQLSEEESRIQTAALKEYDNFISSVREQEKNENSRFKKSEKYKKRTVVLAPFDPNRTDSVTFCRLGLPAWMAKNILRYRSKGGKFRKAEDFKKVYGLTEEHESWKYLFLGCVHRDKYLSSHYLRQPGRHGKSKLERY